MKHHGTCSCGSVQIGIDTDPIMVYRCHCSHCRHFATKTSERPAPYQAAAMMWRWNVHVEGDLVYEHTTALLGLFGLARGKCAMCKDSVWEKGERAVATYAMVMIEPLKLEPDTNIFYNSGLMNGCMNMKRTIYTDIGSLIYEIYVVLFVGIPMLPVSLYTYFFRKGGFSAKRE